MVEEKQSRPGIADVQPTDGGMVDGDMADDFQIKAKIVGEDGPNDIAV